MLPRFAIAALLFLAVLIPPAAHSAGPRTVRQLEDCFDAVCRITAPGSRPGEYGVGTGTAFSATTAEVYLLTNAHVVGQAREVYVEFFRRGYQSPRYPGRVVLRDLHEATNRDVAVVAVDVARLPLLPRRIPLASDADTPRPGQTIWTIGCAKGHWPSMFRGHVFATSRNLVRFMPQPEHGRSGSALINEHLQIVGLVAWQTGGHTPNDPSDDHGLAMSIVEVRAALMRRPHGTAQVAIDAARIGDELVPVRPLAEKDIQCPGGTCPPPFLGGRILPPLRPQFAQPQPYYQPPQQQPQQPAQPNDNGANPWLNPQLEDQDEPAPQPQPQPAPAPAPPTPTPEAQKPPSCTCPPGGHADGCPCDRDPPPVTPPTDRPTLPGVVVDAGGTFLSAKLTALLIGVGVPGWIAAGGLMIARSRLKRRAAQLHPPTEHAPPPQRPRADPQPTAPAQAPAPIILEAPPTPPVMRSETQFMPYEAENKDGLAWEKAIQYYLSRNPGGRSTIETLQQYQKQFLSGLTPKA